MNRFWKLICALALLSGCAAVEVNLAPEVDLSRYEAVRLVSPREDPMDLESAVAEELAEMGYEIVGEEPSAGGVPEVRFSYSIGPDIDEQGKVVSKIIRFAVRFFDSDERLLAEAEYSSGGESATAAEGIEAAFDKLRLARSAPAPLSRKRENPNPKVSPAPLKAQDLPVSEERNRSEPKKPETPESPTPGPSEAPSQGSPWMPRLQSWGFEKWGKE